MTISTPRSPIKLHSGLTLLGIVACAAFVAACGLKPKAPPAPGPEVWAVVDGREIPRSEVEKAYLRVTQSTQAPTPAAEDALAVKLNILNELIVQDLLVAKGRALTLAVADAEVDAALAERKKNLTEEAFQKELAQRNLTMADMKEGLRREMLVQKVIDREVTSKVTVSDQDITDFFQANRAQFSFPETSYRIAQIVVTPVRDQDLANRMNDDATTPDAANRKTQMLMERLKSGASFSDLALDYSEDPRSAAQGGDLGFVPASALQQAPPLLRDAVLKMSPGTVSHVGAGGGHTLVLLVAKEEAGQRDPSMPAVRDGITSAIRGRREQLLRSAYLAAATADAKIVNNLARQLVQSQGKALGSPTAAPPAQAKP